MIWTVAFWKGLGERAIKTFLQSFFGALVTALGATALNVYDITSWVGLLAPVLSVAIIATIGSIAYSFGNASFVAGAPSSNVVDPIYVGDDPATADDGSAGSDNADEPAVDPANYVAPETDTRE